MGLGDNMRAEDTIKRHITNRQCCIKAASEAALAKKTVEGYEQQLRIERSANSFERAWVRDGFWRWMGDGEDHLESLTCPVAIAAADLRVIVEGRAKAEAEVEALKDTIRTLVNGDPAVLAMHSVRPTKKGGGDAIHQKEEVA